MPLVDAKLNWGPIHANSNVLCVIDIRTGGTDPRESDLLEVCFLPLNHSYKPHPEFPMFNIRMRPSYPVDLKQARLSKDKLVDFKESPLDSIKGGEVFEAWTERLALKEHKKIIPVAWNWIEIQPWIKFWLGDLTYEHYIHESHRDLLVLLNFINDREDYFGSEPPYKHPTFGQLLGRSGVKLFDRNSLPANCVALSECYRHILQNR